MNYILIGGDICPIGRNEKLFMNGEVDLLLNDLLPLFQHSDLSIVNLECPLIKEESPINKVGPNLGVTDSCINGLTAMGIDIVTLANNHIMDHGEKGLTNTLRVLQEKGIASVGAGINIEESCKVHIYKLKDIRVGIFAMAEHEFSIASNDRPGANPLDLMNLLDIIRLKRDKYDKLIVILHAGNEQYQYPSPGLQKFCRFAANHGVSAIICQHSHCVGCMEIYNGVPIIYGQGNFIFDISGQNRMWYEGLLILINVDNNGEFHIDLVPVIQSSNQPGVCKMITKESSILMNQFNQRSNDILVDSFVEKRWAEFCAKKKRYYLHTLRGRPGLLRKIAGKFNMINFFDSPKVQLGRLNIVTCESHREALIEVLEQELKYMRNR